MPAREDLSRPPAGLPKAEAKVWRELAGAAIRQGTLVPATREGFAELCELAALKAELKAKWRRSRSEKAEGLLRRFLQLSGRVDTLLARFRLTASGRAEPDDTPRAGANPWAAVSERPPGLPALEDEDGDPDAA